MKLKLKTLTLAALCALSLGAGAQSLSGSTYDTSQVRVEAGASEATVVRVRDVMVDKSNTAGKLFGAVIGGLGGGTVGSQVGDGNGKSLATALFGAVGAAIGAKVASANAQEPGWEIVVKDDRTGVQTSVTQEVDGYPFLAGQSVLVLKRDGVTRVTPAK